MWLGVVHCQNVFIKNWGRDAPVQNPRPRVVSPEADGNEVAYGWTGADSITPDGVHIVVLAAIGTPYDAKDMLKDYQK